jgi:hypothetical protein
MMHLLQRPQVNQTQSEEQQVSSSTPRVSSRVEEHSPSPIHNKDAYISREQAQLDAPYVTSLRGSPP